MTFTATPVDELLTSGRTTDQTVLDSDSDRKWALHNLFLNSESPSTQSITVVSGADYTIRFTGTGSITYSGAAAGTLNGTGVNDVVSVEVTASTTTLTCTVSGTIDKVAVYRSDLNGMQLTTDGEDYTQTAGSVVYQLGRGYTGATALGLQSYSASENIITVTDDLDDAIWLRQGGTWGAADSDGWQEFTANGAVIEHRNLENITNPDDGVQYTWSVDLDYVDHQWLFLAVFDGASNKFAWFDVQNGVKGAVTSGATHMMEPVGQGGYRCSMTITTATDPDNGNIQFGMSNGDNNTSLAFATSDGFRARHPQFEKTGLPTPYILTSGSAEARGDDAITNHVSAFGFDATRGTVVTSFKIDADPGADAVVWSMDDGSANNYAQIYVATSTGAVMAKVVSGGVTQADINVGTYSFGDTSSVAFAFEQNDFAASFDGGSVVTDSSGSMPSGITTFRYGRDFGGRHLEGYGLKFEYYAFRLTNAELQTESA